MDIEGEAPAHAGASPAKRQGSVVRVRIGALGAACVVLVTGCGGGVTKKDVIARGDGICTNALRAIRAVPPSPEQFDRVATIVSRKAAQLRALPRPAEDHQLLDSYIAATTALARDYRTLASAERASDRAATATALAALRANPAPRLAARYGFRTCAGAGATVGSG
jgi:hypothetical protein